MTVIGIGAQKKEYEIPPKTGRKITQIIRKGVDLKQQLETTKQEIEKNNQLLIPHAEHLAGMSGQKTVSFKSHNGKVTVKFGDVIIYVEKEIPKIKEILGPLFDTFFSRETSFAVNLTDIPEIEKLLGKNFSRLIQEQTTHKHKTKIRTILSDGDSDVSKKLRDVISIEPKKPSVSFETVTG